MYQNDDEPWSWRYEAKCATDDAYPEVRVGDIHYKSGVTNTELFFPPRDKELYAPIANAAKAVCTGKDDKGDCPVRKHCLLYAIEIEEEHGIFGGMSHRERNALLRRWQKIAPDLTIEEYVWTRL